MCLRKHKWLSRDLRDSEVQASFKGLKAKGTENAGQTTHSTSISKYEQSQGGAKGRGNAGANNPFDVLRRIPNAGRRFQHV